jgi:hypothetical protein
VGEVVYCFFGDVKFNQTLQWRVDSTDALYIEGLNVIVETATFGLSRTGNGGCDDDDNCGRCSLDGSQCASSRDCNVYVEEETKKPSFLRRDPVAEAIGQIKKGSR